MSQLTERLERDLREVAAGAHPSPSAWESIVARLGDDGGSEVGLARAPDRDRSKRPVWIAVAAAALVVITGSTAVLVTRAGDDAVSTADPDATTNASVPSTTVSDVDPTFPSTAAPFVGAWVSTDVDGSSQTMEIRSVGDRYEFVLRDDFATACAGAPATMTGTGGLLETDERLVIAQPELTCDDGTGPRIGPAPQAELADYTLELNTATDELVDSFGVVWRREGSNDDPIVPSPVTVTVVPSATSGGMWPQSTLDEVRAAQELADAGDPAYTWQLFAQSTGDEEPWEAEVLTRFIEEGLGWEDHLPHGGFAYAEGGGGYGEVVVIRCAPGRTNPLAPLYAEIPPEIRGCAPTIDELTYETVMLSLTQPVRRGAPGIWVVEEWEILQSPSEGPLFWLLYPDLGQVQQAVPPPDDDVTAFLEAFLQARVDGHGVEQYLLTEPDGSPDTDAPLLYATTSGVPYERSTTPQMVQGPVWPTGWREYKVQLVAEDGTVVEQYFHVVRHGGQLGLIYGYAFEHDLQTTENGEPVAVPQSEFGDTVTFTAPPSEPHGDGSEEMRLGAGTDGRVIMAVDPNPELCQDPQEIGENVQPADADAVARSILALPDVEATEPVAVRIAGTNALQMDVTSIGRNDCLALTWMSNVLGDYVEWRMRVYLVDYPESANPPDSAWRPRVLAITVIASQNDFEDVHEQATPILESLEFHPG